MPALCLIPAPVPCVPPSLRRRSCAHCEPLHAPAAGVSTAKGYKKVSNDKKSWADAQKACEAQDMNLAVISSDADSKRVRQVGGSGELWIGLKDGDAANNKANQGETRWCVWSAHAALLL